MEEFLKKANLRPEDLNAIITEWSARGVDDSFVIPNSNGITYGDIKKYMQQSNDNTPLEVPTEEQENEQIAEYKKMNHRELFTTYAMILERMSEILGIPKYVGIENEDPYSIHYNLSAEERQVFVTLQGKLSDVLTVEPKIENEYVEITDRIKATRAEMGKLLREEPHPGIEDTPVDTKLKGEELIRFQELRNRLFEMKRDYPVLFVNELKYDMSEDRTTTKPQPVDVEAQKTIDEELFSMSDADLDAQIARLMKEKDRRAAERRIENLKDESKNPYKDISTEELEEKLKDYFVYSEGESMQDDPNTLEYEAILSELDKRKTEEKADINPYKDLSIEELQDKLRDLQTYSEGESMENDPAAKEYENILAELDRRNEKAAVEKVQNPEVKPEEVQQQEMPESYYELTHDEIIQDSQQEFSGGMTDEELAAAMQNIEENPTPVVVQETTENGMDDFQPPVVVQETAVNSLPDAADVAFNRDIQQATNTMDDFQPPVLASDAAENDFQAPVVVAPTQQAEIIPIQPQAQQTEDPNTIDGEYREVPQAATSRKRLKFKALKNLNETLLEHRKLTTGVGFLVGLGLGTAMDVSGLAPGALLIPKGLELASRAKNKLKEVTINAWTEKHPNGRIARVTNNISKGIDKIKPEFVTKIQKSIHDLNQKAKNSALRPFVNGFSVGYAITWAPQFIDNLSSGIEHVTGLSR